MFHKSNHAERPKNLIKKQFRFDEENIRHTLHPIHKDYGLMTCTEAKTPFPRYDHPVAAEELRVRLQGYLDRADRMLLHNDLKNDDDDDERSYNREPQTPTGSLESEDEERRHSEFIKKRKQFYKAEYIIAQQKSMSSEMPEPGPSIGNNWRISNNAIGNPTYANEHNTYPKTLREIAEQIECLKSKPIN